MGALCVPTFGAALLKAVGTLVKVSLVSHTQQRTERTDFVVGWCCPTQRAARVFHVDFFHSVVVVVVVAAFFRSSRRRRWWNRRRRRTLVPWSHDGRRHRPPSPPFHSRRLRPALVNSSPGRSDTPVQNVGNPERRHPAGWCRRVRTIRRSFTAPQLDDCLEPRRRKTVVERLRFRRRRSLVAARHRQLRQRRSRLEVRHRSLFAWHHHRGDSWRDEDGGWLLRIRWKRAVRYTEHGHSLPDKRISCSMLAFSTRQTTIFNFVDVICASLRPPALTWPARPLDVDLSANPSVSLVAASCPPRRRRTTVGDRLCLAPPIRRRDERSLGRPIARFNPRDAMIAP